MLFILIKVSEAKKNEEKIKMTPQEIWKVKLEKQKDVSFSTEKIGSRKTKVKNACVAMKPQRNWNSDCGGPIWNGNVCVSFCVCLSLMLNENP